MISYQYKFNDYYNKELEILKIKIVNCFNKNFDIKSKAWFKFIKYIKNIENQKKVIALYEYSIFNNDIKFVKNMEEQFACLLNLKLYKRDMKINYIKKLEKDPFFDLIKIK